MVHRFPGAFAPEHLEETDCTAVALRPSGQEGARTTWNIRRERGSCVPGHANEAMGFSRKVLCGCTFLYLLFLQAVTLPFV